LNRELLQNCRLAQVASRRGDLTKLEWSILERLLTVEREAGKCRRARPPRGQLQQHQWHPAAAAHLRTMARCRKK